MTRASAATLHVTNGDAVLYLFKKAGLVGTQLAWHDALNEGPVPTGLTLPQTSAVRVRYVADRGLGNPIKVSYRFEKRDALIFRAAEFREVILWFEHDLYDQLQLLQVLAALRDLDLEPGVVSLVQSDQYLGSMTAAELSALLPRRRPLTASVAKSARTAWERFTSADPHDLLQVAREDAPGLPFLRAAAARLCEEYPHRSDGLSRSQRQALSAVAQGAAGALELYRRAQAREEAHFQADTAFVRLLNDLCDPRAPLLVGREEYELTPLGRSILAGDTDWLAHATLDRWIGGVHLTLDNDVRWDDDANSFV